MPLKSSEDGRYIANWVPSASGQYLIQVFIDGRIAGIYVCMYIFSETEIRPGFPQSTAQRRSTVLLTYSVALQVDCQSRPSLIDDLYLLIFRYSAGRGMTILRVRTLHVKAL